MAQAKKPTTKSYTTAAEMKKKIKNNNNTTKEEPEPIEWSENVTGETFCNQVQVPFNYITNRFMLSSDDKIIEEERYFEKCTCKRLASIFTSNTDDPVTDADVHEYNKGECPTKSIDCGSVLFKLHVYKCDNDRIGFGIRATRDISTGSFICEYVGEIISREQAQFREKEYSKQGWYYLHDITSPVNEKKYSIDPTRSGNVGRFFNHSCKPNCTTLELPNNAQKHKKHASPSDAPTEKERIIETMKYVPRLAFFACKDVKKGEQLTIDYSPNRFGNRLKKTVKCMCSERRANDGCFDRSIEKRTQHAKVSAERCTSIFASSSRESSDSFTEIEKKKKKGTRFRSGSETTRRDGRCSNLTHLPNAKNKKYIMKVSVHDSFGYLLLSRET